MFALLLCLTAVSYKCKVSEGGRFLDGSNTTNARGENWLDSLTFTAAPDLMAGVKDAVHECVSEHNNGIIVESRSVSDAASRAYIP